MKMITILSYCSMEAYQFTTSVHVGTHMDAPCHFCATCWRMHDIPLDAFFGPAVVVDIKNKVQADPNYELQIADLLEWEEEYGNIPSGAMLMVSRFYSLWQHT